MPLMLPTSSETTNRTETFPTERLKSLGWSPSSRVSLKTSRSPPTERRRKSFLPCDVVGRVGVTSFWWRLREGNGTGGHEQGPFPKTVTCGGQKP